MMIPCRFTVEVGVKLSDHPDNIDAAKHNVSLGIQVACF